VLCSYSFNLNHMAKGSATITSFYCTACNKLNYTNHRNKKEHPKIEVSKFCNQCKKHTLHKGKDAK
jgi:large subunit ribosomal protein L33